jgi:hypothetical protein
MKNLLVYRSILIMAVLGVLVTAGCAGNVPATSAAATQEPGATQVSAASPEPAVSATSTSEMSDMSNATPQATPGTGQAVVPVSGSDILYQDNFTDPSTGWTEDKFDNYFIGYHEPEYYHVEVDSPNYKTTVFAPGKQVFDDFTLDLKVLTSSSKTSPTGDFRYGAAFRRSGDQYYAFTISPRTKKWYVLKSSPNALTVLTEGTDDEIHDLDTDDTLRVDAQGSEFVFHINDKIVGEVSDPDYAKGEVGLYVESFDSPNTHVHFDNLTVRNFEVSILCNVDALTMNVRNGPGKDFPSSQFIKSGDTVEPVGRTADNQWIKIKLTGSDEQGWISNASGYLTCTPDVKLLPVVTP